MIKRSGTLVFGTHACALMLGLALGVLGGDLFFGLNHRLVQYDFDLQKRYRAGLGIELCFYNLTFFAVVFFISRGQSHLDGFDNLFFGYALLLGKLLEGRENDFEIHYMYIGAYLVKDVLLLADHPPTLTTFII